MPQMMPMNWLFLPSTFLVCFLILATLLFSLKLPLVPSLSLKENMMFKPLWKW